MLTLLLSIENEEDKTFVEEIYLRYEKQMYTIAYGILNQHCDAQDCVHETVRIIIDSLDKFKSAYQNNSLDSLVMIACRNCAINMYNKIKKRSCFETSTVIYDSESQQYTEIDIPDPYADIQKLIITEEQIETLHQKIRKLDPIYRDVLTLKMMDFSYEEIATLLCISEETARQRLFRARKKINENDLRGK